ncbi:hypothetical protein GCM10010278_25190 [Streptomyces melanogenes]|nr:hypothetical protein GCM10010278_25190 [Streptomyces melanogenes]
MWSSKAKVRYRVIASKSYASASSPTVFGVSLRRVRRVALGAWPGREPRGVRDRVEAVGPVDFLELRMCAMFPPAYCRSVLTHRNGGH